MKLPEPVGSSAFSTSRCRGERRAPWILESAEEGGEVRASEPFEKGSGS